MIKGSALLWENELKITEASVRFWDQDEWAEWFSWEIEHGNAEQRKMVVTQNAMPRYEATVNGVQVVLEDNSSWRYSPRQGQLDMKQSSG